MGAVEEREAFTLLRSDPSSVTAFAVTPNELWSDRHWRSTYLYSLRSATPSRGRQGALPRQCDKLEFKVAEPNRAVVQRKMPAIQARGCPRALPTKLQFIFQFCTAPASLLLEEKVPHRGG